VYLFAAMSAPAASGAKERRKRKSVPDASLKKCDSAVSTADIWGDDDHPSSMPSVLPATNPKPAQPAAKDARAKPAQPAARPSQPPPAVNMEDSPWSLLGLTATNPKPAQPAAKDARAKPAQPAAHPSTCSFPVDLDFHDPDVEAQAPSPTASLSGNGSPPQAPSSSTPTNSPSDSESSTPVRRLASFGRKSAPRQYSTESQRHVSKDASPQVGRKSAPVRRVSHWPRQPEHPPPLAAFGPRQPSHPPPTALAKNTKRQRSSPRAAQPKKTPRARDIQRLATTVTLQAASGARSWKEQSMGQRVDQVLENIIEASDFTGCLISQATDLMSKHYFERFKKAQEEVLARATQGVNGYKLCEMTEEDMDRPFTCNYSQNMKVGPHQLSASWDSRVQLQLKGKMAQHAGEVRSWPTSRPDTWRLMRVANDHLSYITVGFFFRGTEIETTIEKRMAASGAQRDPIFSSSHELGKADNCWPDLENAISTLAVWDTREENVCLREQYGVTLAELFSEFGSTQTYRTLLEEWQKGKLLVRAKPIRGARGSGIYSSRCLR